MSYDVLVKEALALSYEEQVSLMAFLANSLQEKIKESKDFKIEKAEKIQRINTFLAEIPEEEQLMYCDAGLEAVREALKNDTW